MRDRLPLLLGFVALALAIAMGSVVIGEGIRDRNRNDTISVTGSAKERISSDYVVWNASVASQADTPQAAAPKLASWAAQVRAFLAANGAKPGEVTENPVTTETLTDDSNHVTGYRLTRTFEVRSPRVTEIAALVEKSQRLFNQGVPLQAQQPQYIYTRLADLRPRLLAAATKDALARAKVLVEATGDHLGGLRGVNVGVFQVTAPNSTEVSDYGVYDTSTRQKDVTAVVNVDLALE